MRSAIKFLKFDLRMIKASSKQYFLIAFIPFATFALSGESYIFALSYLLLFWHQFLLTYREMKKVRKCISCFRQKFQVWF